MKIIKVTLIIAIISFCSCKDRPDSSAHKNYNGEIIKQSGNYDIDSNLCLSIKTKKSKIIYEMSFSNEVILSGDFSAFHRWFFFIDNKKDMWFYSGDIGVFVWKKTGLNQTKPDYKKINIYKEQAMLDKMPTKVKNNLPDSYWNLIK